MAANGNAKNRWYVNAPSNPLNSPFTIEDSDLEYLISGMGAEQNAINKATQEGSLRLLFKSLLGKKEGEYNAFRDFYFSDGETREVFGMLVNQVCDRRISLESKPHSP